MVHAEAVTHHVPLPGHWKGDGGGGLDVCEFMPPAGRPRADFTRRRSKKQRLQRKLARHQRAVKRLIEGQLLDRGTSVRRLRIDFARH